MGEQKGGAPIRTMQEVGSLGKWDHGLAPQVTVLRFEMLSGSWRGMCGEPVPSVGPLSPLAC